MAPFFFVLPVSYCDMTHDSCLVSHEVNRIKDIHTLLEPPPLVRQIASMAGFSTWDNVNVNAGHDFNFNFSVNGSGDITERGMDHPTMSLVSAASNDGMA
jgi:hypothetical protein